MLHLAAPVFKIDFALPKMEKPAKSIPEPKKTVITPPSETEKAEFLDNLRIVSPNSAVLSACYKDEALQSEYRTRYPTVPCLPPTLMSLGRRKYRDMNAEELTHACEQFFDEFCITNEESNFLFRSTVLQSSSLLWFEHRRGRLTASKFGEICHTSLASPSKSLTESILQKRTPPRTAALQWGIDKEPVAKEEYVRLMKGNHDSFEVTPAGLCVNPKAPHLGASPDGLTFCSCCGSGVLEVKCPYSVRETIPTSVSYIIEGTEGVFKLSRKHKYYYQIQGQMSILEVLYCDFVCWTPHGVHLERIAYDVEFVNNMIPQLTCYFLGVILPEILCTVNEPSSSTETYCVCQQGESGKMIACDSTECEYVWFHYGCVDLPNNFEPGDAEWLCPDCLRKTL